MKRILLCLAALCSCLPLLGGCAEAPSAGSRSEPGWNNIPFADGQLYAVAHLGYQEMGSLDYYVEEYLDNDQIPVHYLSPGDFYLVIPRYGETELSLYQNDFTTSNSTLLYENPSCRPFVLQCNVSDIFSDATIRLSYQGSTVEFSPFISLKDGSVEVGEAGLDITMEQGRGG